MNACDLIRQHPKFLPAFRMRHEKGEERGDFMHLRGGCRKNGGEKGDAIGSSSVIGRPNCRSKFQFPAERAWNERELVRHYDDVT